ncbi:amino acid ABC transporter membrane protein 1 (PAAT family) [Humitalea rosea]|uniref:Amino acid ABC transporter membrane protein 1 (PAAT family) n=1 Tax=Humitalea rosea TaxID=990373 RepID=A0A2W7IG22_9PROT|nr:amino acid ABC transporter permease [Humitalea rosea]PZW45906.1 amino acid ABC transporter membrane protein 1 (PAAT family) [Humitalea rosea]
MKGWDAFVSSFLNLQVIGTYWPVIVQGFFVTVELAVLIVIVGLALGLVLAVIRAFGIRPLNWLIIFIVDVFRALPPLVIIVLLYFGLPAAGLSFSGFTATFISLALILAAFSEEIYWAGITAVPHGQTEAARALGLRFLHVLFLVVLPQALRMVIPPLVNRTIAITKGTALGSVVAVSEILGAAQSSVAFSLNPSPLTLGALAYLILFLPVVIVGRRIELRFARPFAR